MEKEKIFVAKDTLLETYKNGNTDQKNVLERLYGSEMFRPNIMDRVKTFDDAVNVLGYNHQFVIEYRRLDNPTTNHLAFLKLRIITAALNEGWEPKFTKDEYRYYPYFYFYTKEQIDKLTKNELANVFVFDKPIGANVGLAYAVSSCSFADSSVCSRLCFKTKELTKYAGKQFIKLYVDYYMN